MGHNKKLFTTLFVLFVAAISSVAGGFALTNPSKVRSEAKSGDDATLRVYFYMGPDTYGAVEDIEHTWSGGNKANASIEAENLKVPSNHQILVWKSTRQVIDHYVTSYNGDGGGYWVYKDEVYDVLGRNLVFAFDKTGSVFTGWIEGDGSGYSEKGKFYGVGDGVTSNESGNVTKHLWAKWEPIFFNVSFQGDVVVESDTTARSTNTMQDGISWDVHAKKSNGDIAAGQKGARHLFA